MQGLQAARGRRRRRRQRDGPNHRANAGAPVQAETSRWVDLVPITLQSLYHCYLESVFVTASAFAPIEDLQRGMNESASRYCSEKSFLKSSTPPSTPAMTVCEGGQSGVGVSGSGER